MKIGICSMKSLRDGRVMIEANSKQEIELLDAPIREKCCQQLDANIPKLWNPNLIVFNIPEDVTVENAEEIIINQNPELNLTAGDIKPKFIFNSKRNIRNLIIEVRSQTRKQILQTKLKIGWIICNAEDYVKVNRCYKCSRYNHRARDCRGEETCPQCAGNHNLKDCKTLASDFKCINCTNYNKYHKGEKVCENHSSMNKMCPSLLAAIEKYKQNIDY
ncbi:hypothetical protein C0J52_20968 [Blattella germanica]|nr:hypothetical protein C0J52_20968 [Blattella germanica]